MGKTEMGKRKKGMGRNWEKGEKGEKGDGEGGKE